jgi:glycosyltransferase involved in cell wall biosynthesis
MEVKHIVLVISSLGGGGAERAIVDLAAYFAAHGRHVTLVTLDGDSPDSYLLSSGIDRVRVNIMWPSRHLWDRISGALRRLVLIRRAVRGLDPSVVISFGEMTNVRVLLALLGTHIQVIVSERSNPLRHPVGRLWDAARRITYPLADAVVVQTENVARWTRGWLAANRIVVIPNAVRKLTSTGREMRPTGMLEGQVMLAIGRIAPEKGYDLLIQAFAAVAADCRNWNLVVLGDGPDRHQLEEMARSLGLAERVQFAGRQDNPFDWLRHASLFVLSSRYEGFPNALLEAMQCGLPVVAFDCANGPSDIIRDGTDGILVPSEDVSALAQALSKLARDSELRARLAKRASEVAVRFPPEKIYGSWLALCDRLERESS